MEKITQEDLQHCIRVMEALAGDSIILSSLSKEDRLRLLVSAGRTIHPERTEVTRRLKALRREKRKQKQNRDRLVRASAEIRTARLDSVFVPPPRVLALESETNEAPARELEHPRACYVCKTEFTRLHFFYDSMCPKCAPFNYEKRFQTASLQGRVALITGARLKIGYQAALMMLRAGARVIVTTRFPQDAAIRYAREPDFAAWGARLQIHGLDLRHSPSVETFTRFVNQTYERLDILINNAAQTVRRPPGFYSHLMSTEKLAHEELPADARALLLNHQACKVALTGPSAASGSTSANHPSSGDTTWLSSWHGRDPKVLGLTSSAELSQIPYQCDDPEASEALFPAGKLDADLQQVDLRGINTWRLTLGDVPTAEMLEVQLVNSVAPFILCSKLKALMLRHPTGEKHIVNVSAMEGKFARHTKTDKHPHTNMAKAALNMMTLTSARDYAKSGIFMNAVDTGWVTDEDPAAISARKQEEHDFQPPLDIVDGAARVCDPFFSGLLTGKHSWGNFLKDYFPTEW
ncbi:MAG: oxidoreductase [Bdellovibrionales bacterium GWC1_52_8]|nr:MAG: oxidoreductase [Bdellovibrionales bacterium GWB1_52_6]OFZ02882.1 MAG: oxidoreductase [Bdellovibrionales bacterium GWA1_52_35]OFZ33761.1 MAG: oxidoreductase [Bdellovibrionales bacterium GWC1_52_8]